MTVATDRKRMVIGAEYRDTFASLVKLLSADAGGAAARVEETADGKLAICTDVSEYVYDERYGGFSGDSAPLKMGKDGASWFAPVREGKAFDDGTSEWKQLIYKVARDFHDRFSIIEYKQCDGSGNANGEETERKITALVSRLFDKRGVTLIKGNDRNKGTEDIYGASVKLELGATGQSHHVVMCKIFFRRTSRGITPLTAAEAAEINAKLETAEDNDDALTLTPEESANINNVTVNAVRTLINGEYPVSFKESLCFSTRKTVDAKSGKQEDNYDLKTYRELARRAHTNNAPVTVRSVRVLGISHVKWINDYYEVAFGGRVCLQVIVGFNESISLRCVNCNGVNLVTSNMINYTYTDKDGATYSETVKLDYSRQDLGIPDAKLAEIKKYGEIANHLFEIGCDLSSRLGKRCSTCVCKSQTVTVDGETKCADCPYPEVVYTDYMPERPVKYLTSKLTFVNDTLSMALSERAASCSRCGRAFTKESLTGGQCKLCAGIENLDEEGRRRAKKKYMRYAAAFSPTVRIKYMFKPKLCVEDDTAVVFALGNDTYVLSKLDITEGGFIAQPVRVN